MTIKVVTRSINGVWKLLDELDIGMMSLPNVISLDGGKTLLIKAESNDAYYTTTLNECSCPEYALRPGKACKHQRKYIGALQKSTGKI